jgi:hypothetical protein
LGIIIIIIILKKDENSKKREMKIGGGWSYPHGRSGVVKPPPRPRGWSGHPKGPKKEKKRKMGGRTTPKGLGLASATL